MSFKDKIRINCIRPATVWGVSPRMRFDVSVNLLTLQAIKKKQITVFGGNQIRPNIHLQDMIRLYEFFLKRNIPSGFYNAGFENLKILDIAKLVSKIIPSKIKIKKNNDRRSYRQNSEKLLLTGFKKCFGITDAINEIKEMYELKKLKETKKCYTVIWMKKLGL